MSVGGPSPLGTLLVQRLEAALGTTLSQQANLVTGARPDAVSQAANPEPTEGARNETLRHPRDSVDRATAQAGQNARNMVDKARQEARSAAPLLARNIPDTASTPSAPTTLGPAARTILALLAGYPDPAPPVQGRQPLLSPSALPASGGGGGNPIATQLAAALSQAVQGSGMFYESHLASLAFGKFSPAHLTQEPQAQIGRAAPVPSPAPGPASLAAADTAPAATSTAHGVEPGTPTPSPASPLSANTQPAHIPGLDPQAHTLVRQQLEVLANQSMAWHGEAWPGAAMDWQISRREPQDHSAADASGHWATRLALNLPGLGQVQARLTLAGRQLVMHLVSPQSAELLDTHAEALRMRYAAQGLQLSRLSIVPQEVQPDATPHSEGASP